MIVLIKRIFDKKSQETGAILEARPGERLNIQRRHEVENALVQFAFGKLYPHHDLTVFRNMFSEVPSIMLVRDLNNLNYEMVDIDRY